MPRLVRRGPCPTWSATLALGAGLLFSLSLAHRRSDVAYALAEAVSHRGRDGWDTLARFTCAEQLALVSGGARSAWWSQLLADILQAPQALGAGGEAGGALGAARLAWLADGGRVAGGVHPTRAARTVRAGCASG